MTDEKTQVKKDVLDLIEGASSERLQAISALLNMSDEKAVSYGDALSLLSESEYNTGTLRLAIAKVKDEQGLQIVRTRTSVRVFKYLIDEDDVDGGYNYRGFYVRMITPEQKVAISTSAVAKLQSFIGHQNMTEEELKKNPTKMLDFIQSDAFVSIMSEPNQKIREIVIENMVEIEVGDDGAVRKPIHAISTWHQDNENEIMFQIKEDVPEFILLQLEDDLRLLMEQQGVMVKNLPMTDMFAR